MGLQTTRDNRIRLQPNPAKDQIRILSEAKIEAITVTDAVGRIVWFQQNTEPSNPVLNVGLWPRGIYLVGVKGDGPLEFLRVVLE